MTTAPTIIKVPLSALRERDANPNHMEPEQFALLVEAIRRVGFLQPVLVRDSEDGTYEIVDGAHRARAAAEVGMVEVTAVVTDVDDNDASALQIGMNRMRGELDLGEVARQVASLSDAGWTVAELTLTGFSTEELDDLLKAARPEAADLMDQSFSTPDTEEDKPLKPFLLELTFETKDDLQQAKRGLKRAAGKGRELSDGLLRLLGTRE